jgi:hypothetical protein
MTTNADQILADIERARAQAATARANAAAAQARGEVYLVAQYTAQAQSNEQNAQALQIQYNAAVNSPGTASAGQVVADEQKGNSNNSNTQNPSAPAQTVPVFTQDQINRNLETGTNDRVRTTTETQATPPAPLQPFASPGDEDAVQAPFSNTRGGAGAPQEDGTPKNSLSVQQTINANFSQRIEPRPNILDEYASYTYSITWYLLTPEQFNQMSVQSKINISNWQILVQSGGASITPGNGQPGRNEFFSNDYYLDNFVIETFTEGKGTGGPMNLGELNFTVTEPNGFTLIENLYRAVSSTYKKANINVSASEYVQADYCICIRFYGYNEFGELQQVGRTTNPGGGRPGVAVSTDSRAVVEKFIPFRIAELKTKIVSKAVEYQIQGHPVGYNTAFSSQRGTIPFAYELAGSNVGELLNGRPVGTNYTKSDGRPNTSNPPSANPTQPAEPTTGAGVDANGNFTGDITPGSFSSVIGA